MFRALGAFAGEIPLEAIEAVCETLRVDVLTPVAGLVDKNLLVRIGDGETHFRMLETIHEFAEERLELTGEADADNARARAVLEEALSMARPRHDKWLTSVATGNLGLALVAEDPAQALMLLKESLSFSYEIGHRWLTVRRLEDLARVLASSDRAEMSARLLGASESLRDRFGLARSSSLQAALNDAGAAARKHLGSAAFEAAWRQGRAMPADEAVALALGRSAPARGEPIQRPGGLTGREVQIVLDIARGLTNRQIAVRLGISQHTVDAHVQNILNKLGMDRRVQVAAWASAHFPKGTLV